MQDFLFRDARFTHATGIPAGAAGEGVPKRGVRRQRRQSRSLTFCTQCLIAAWNCGGLSSITVSICKDLECDILSLDGTLTRFRDLKRGAN